MNLIPDELQSGSSPSMRLLDKSKANKNCNSHIDAGIWPLKWLEKRSNATRFGVPKSLGKGPIGSYWTCPESRGYLATQVIDQLFGSNLDRVVPTTLFPYKLAVHHQFCCWTCLQMQPEKMLCRTSVVGYHVYLCLT